MSSIDKSVSLIDAINIFISEDIEELLVWDEGESKWIWMLTTVDIIRLIMHSLKCIAKREPISTYSFIQFSRIS
jgi:predicted transcriptional regulator